MGSADPMGFIPGKHYTQNFLLGQLNCGVEGIKRGHEDQV